MPIDSDAILAAIDEAKEGSYGSDDTSIASHRAASIEAYLGLNVNPAPSGRSQVVDKSVYETVQVLLPSLVRIFAGSSDEVCKAVPIGPDDEAGAEQTTAVLRHWVTEQNQWEQVCSDWIHDALLLGNGYAMAYWDQTDQVIRERYEGQYEDQIAALVQDKGVQVVAHSQRLDEQATQEAQQQYELAIQQWQQAALMAQAQGQQPPPQPQPPQPVMLHDIEIERRETEGKVCIRVLPPEHCVVSAQTPDWTLNECDYFEYREQRSIADLRSMGLEVSDDISDDWDADSEEDAARDRFGEDRTQEKGKGALRKVWARMVWVRAEAEGDGLARLYYCLIVGRTILYVEPATRIPVASMTAQPMPHRHIGLSIYDTVGDLQEIKTAIKRGALDNLYLANNGRTAVSDRVNLSDMLDSRPGGIVRMLDGAMPAEGHLMPLQHPFAFDSIVGSLEYFDQDRQNRSGASRYFSGTDAGAINKTAAGTMALQNMASMRVEHIARMMAPAVEALFSAVWEVISKHANKPLALKLKGNWTMVDPQAWMKKRDIRISVGVGAGNKESMLQALQGVLAAQMQVGIPLGLVAREEVHATNVEIAKLAGFANPGRFWKDPATLPPPQQQVPPEVQREQLKLQAEAQKTQYEAQQEQMKFQAESQLERERMAMQAELDRNRQEWEARQKTLEAQQRAEVERIKAEYQATIEQQRLALEKYKADLDAQTKLAIADKAAPPPVDITPIHAAIQQVMEAINAPAEIVRDPQTGRAVGVRRGETVRQIKRGPDGRAMGLQ